MDEHLTRKIETMVADEVWEGLCAKAEDEGVSVESYCAAVLSAHAVVSEPLHPFITGWCNAEREQIAEQS